MSLLVSEDGCGGAAWARDRAGGMISLRQRVIYGDDSAGSGLTQAQARGLNLVGQPYRHYDEAGLLQFERFDFKGNLDAGSTNDDTQDDTGENTGGLFGGLNRLTGLAALLNPGAVRKAVTRREQTVVANFDEARW